MGPGREYKIIFKPIHADAEEMQSRLDDAFALLFEEIAEQLLVDAYKEVGLASSNF